MDIPRKKGGRPTKRPDPELLAELYAKHTAEEIAKQYGVKTPTVRSWVARIRKGA